MKDHYQGGVWAMMALRKGGHSTYMASRISKVIRDAGYKKCILKCDQEPAIKELQREIRKELWSERARIAKDVKDELGNES
eukprot:11288010-Karenia_brevis.AAC.1